MLINSFSTTSLFTLSGFDISLTVLAAALLALLAVILLRRSALSDNTKSFVASPELPERISPSSALPLVNTLVNDIRDTGVQLEIQTNMGYGLILEVRQSAKDDVQQSGLLKLLCSVDGVSDVFLGGGKSNGRGPRTPITISVYFNDDARGHHAAINLVEAIA